MKPRHYASSRVVVVGILVSLAVTVCVQLWIPSAALDLLGVVLKNLWAVLGPIGAFSVQILLQLMNLGDEKSLSVREHDLLSPIVDQRMRYLGDLTLVAVMALVSGVAAGSTPTSDIYQRPECAIASGLAVWTVLLAARLPWLYAEIKAFRWRLARTRADDIARRAALDGLSQKAAATDPEPPATTDFTP